jgi:hypothetical protein
MFCPHIRPEKIPSSNLQEEKRREEEGREQKRREEKRAVLADCLFVLFWDLEDWTILSSETLVNVYGTHGSPHARRYCILRKESGTCVPTQVGEAVPTLCRGYQVYVTSMRKVSMFLTTFAESNALLLGVGYFTKMCHCT